MRLRMEPEYWRRNIILAGPLPANLQATGQGRLEVDWDRGVFSSVSGSPRGCSTQSFPERQPGLLLYQLLCNHEYRKRSAAMLHPLPASNRHNCLQS